MYGTDYRGQISLGYKGSLCRKVKQRFFMWVALGAEALCLHWGKYIICCFFCNTLCLGIEAFGSAIKTVFKDVLAWWLSVNSFGISYYLDQKNLCADWCRSNFFEQKISTVCGTECFNTGWWGQSLKCFALDVYKYDCIVGLGYCKC